MFPIKRRQTKRTNSLFPYRFILNSDWRPPIDTIMMWFRLTLSFDVVVRRCRSTLSFDIRQCRRQQQHRCSVEDIRQYVRWRDGYRYWRWCWRCRCFPRMHSVAVTLYEKRTATATKISFLSRVTDGIERCYIFLWRKCICRGRGRWWCCSGGGIICFDRRYLTRNCRATRENTSPLRSEIPTAYDFELSLADKSIALEDLMALVLALSADAFQTNLVSTKTRRLLRRRHFARKINDDDWLF